VSSGISAAADGYATGVHESMTQAAQRLGIYPAEMYSGANRAAVQAEAANPSVPAPPAAQPQPQQSEPQQQAADAVPPEAQAAGEVLAQTPEGPPQQSEAAVAVSANDPQAVADHPETAAAVIEQNPQAVADHPEQVATMLDTAPDAVADQPELAARVAEHAPDAVDSLTGNQPEQPPAPQAAPPEAAPPAAQPDLSPQQQEVVALRELATSAEDWAYIRAQERAQGLPETPLQPVEIADRAALAQLVAETSGTAAVTAPTEDLSPQQAAGQRTDQARALMEMQGEMGVTVGEGMDPRIVERAQRQQAMVDGLEVSAAGMTPDQQALADLTAELRAQGHADPASVTKQTVANLQELGASIGMTQDALDAMPPEQRLLMAGFSPEEIAQHFTPRDVDADRVVDPATAGPTGTARDTVGLAAGGDLNSDARPATATEPALDPTVRRPLTPAEAERAVDMNVVLAESFREGNQFGKLIPDTALGDLQTGRATGGSGATARDYGDAGLRGDVGELLNTSIPADRGAGPVTSLDQAQMAGLDYPTSVYVDDPNGPTAQFRPEITDPDGAGLARVQGTITPEIAAAAEVAVGRGVMGEAQSQAGELAQITQQRQAQRDALTAAGQPIPADLSPDLDPHIPNMLRTDSSADTLPMVKERTRESPIDTRTGLGYSTTERADMPVVPNQELTIGSTVPLPDDASVVITRPDGTQVPALEMPAGGSGPMVPSAGADPATQQRIDNARIAGEQRVIDAGANAAPRAPDEARYDDYWARLRSLFGLGP
jgi:hypothetical protein